MRESEKKNIYVNLHVVELYEARLTNVLHVNTKQWMVGHSQRLILCQGAVWFKSPLSHHRLDI